jgi:hypothetical protein
MDRIRGPVGRDAPGLRFWRHLWGHKLAHTQARNADSYSLAPILPSPAPRSRSGAEIRRLSGARKGGDDDPIALAFMSIIA